MEFKFKLEDFDTTLVIEFDEEYDVEKIKEIAEDAYHEYMYAEEDEDMDEEMFAELDNMTVGEWITYRLDDNGYYTTNYYEEHIKE